MPSGCRPGTSAKTRRPVSAPASSTANEVSRAALVSATTSVRPPAVTTLLPALAKVRPTIMLSVPIIMEKIYKNKIVPTFTSKPLVARLYAIPFFRVLFHRLAGKSLKRTFGGRIKFFGIGGAKVDPVVERFLKEARFPYAIGYGLT